MRCGKSTRLYAIFIDKTVDIVDRQTHATHSQKKNMLWPTFTPYVQTTVNLCVCVCVCVCVLQDDTAGAETSVLISELVTLSLCQNQFSALRRQ